MKTSRKLLTLILAVLMLVSVLPLNAFAATYKVYLHCGPEGWGSTAYTLTKNSSSNLALYHDKASVYANYAMLPGKQVFNDQRTFIEWNTAYNATTGRGTGTSYYDYYTANKSTTLYAIWGYNIQFNADGGTYPNPTSGKDIYLTYVASYNLNDQSDPKTDYSYCLPDLFSNVPTKTGCRRVASSGRPAYALLEKDLTFFCWETQDQNLTIPPTGGYMEWEYFHCADTAKGRAPEFYAIWEPSVTYKANGGSGSMSTDYLTWTGDALWDYESYTAKSNKFTKSGATFTGWNTKADGSGTSYKVGAQLGGQRKNSDPITLYAQWSDNSTPSTPTYTITFDANGGTLSGTKTYSIKTGDTYKSVIGSSMPTPTRSGYTFDGWYNEKYGYTLNLNDTFNVSENVTFKAQWTKNAETKAWTITFDPNGGTMVGSSTYGINTGDYYKDIFGSMPQATRNGYTLTGWYNEKYSYTLNMSDYFAISENATFKAKWTKNTTNTYTLTFDTNGGKMPSGYSTTYNFEADEKFIDVIGGYPVPTKSGYIFEGWRRTDWTSDFWVGTWGTQPFTFGHDVTLKAEWSAHTHTYNSSVTTKATCTTEGVKTYTCSCGDSYTETIDALGHNYKTTTTQPTCAEAGKTVTTCSRCGDSYEEAIPATGEHNYESTVTEPTCNEDGKTAYTCTACGDSYEEAIPATGKHNYESTVTEPTCNEDGKTVYTCTACGDSYEEAIPATGEHDYESTVTEPTCTEDGKTVYTCTVCKDSYEEAIPATGKHDYESTVTDSTCTEDGKTVYTCTVCGDSYSEKIDALGHNYQPTVIDATCGEGGKITYTCSRCQDSYVEVIPATGKHNYESAVTEPTCVTDGYTTYTCTVCSDSYTDNITEALGHKVIIVEGYDATCTESGLTSGTKCSVCDEIFVAQETIEALGHDYFSDITAPTCTEEGYTTYFCFGCGDRYVADYVEPAGHDYHTIVTEPTCVTDGYTTYTCTVCSDSYTDNITEALGHNVIIVEGYDATCTESGLTSGTKCSVCDEIFVAQETIEALGHDYFSDITAPTCTEEGYTTYFCFGCGDRYVADYVEPAGHDYHTIVTEATCATDGEIYYLCWECLDNYTEVIPATGKHNYESTVTAPTCTEEGKTVYTCTACGDSYTDTVAAIGHKYSSTVKDATCTEDGATVYTCDNCGDSYEEIIPSLGKHNYEYTVTDPTCENTGKIVYTCTACGDSYEAVISALGHKWGDWVETTAPTTTAAGVETRACSVCKATETREIPMLSTGTPVVADVFNYTVTLNGIKDIKEIRFAIGSYTTGSEVKAAEKNVTLDASTVAKYTADGVFSYELPWVGEYTFWVRTNSGEQYFLYTEVDEINPYVTSYGVKLTVNDFGENYKDMWLAEGTFNSYNEIKASTAFKYQASANKMAVYAKTNHDFSYTMTNPGPYTVLIRYNDGTFDVIHHELTVDYPVFIENGLQVTVTNIPDIKIIRTAYGHYESVAEIKAASGVRNFNTKVIGKDTESYMIQYRDEGEVTLIVEYNNGYKHFYYYNVEQKVPAMVQDGNKITFGDLEDLYIIRYAPGKYTTSNNIKNAPGSKYLKSDAINENGEIVIDNLTSGRWSFMVQYNDESYNFYVIDVE